MKNPNMDLDNVEQLWYNGNRVRIVHNGEVWFVAQDVAGILGLTNIRMSLESLDDDEKGVSNIYTPGGMQNMTVISEAGLYTLIMKSRKPEAKNFRRWVTHDVIPQIMRTGHYEIRPIPATPDTTQTALPEPEDTIIKPSIQGIIKAADKIYSKAFSCKEPDDFYAVLALDKVFEEFTGKSALGIAGIKLEHKIERKEWRMPGIISHTDINHLAWEHDFPKLPKDDE